MDRVATAAEPNFTRTRGRNLTRHPNLRTRGSVRIDVMGQAIENISFIKKMKHKVQNIQETSLSEIFKDGICFAGRVGLQRGSTPVTRFPRKMPNQANSVQVTKALQRQLSRIFTKQNTWIEENKKSVVISPLTTRRQNIIHQHSSFNTMKTQNFDHPASKMAGFHLEKRSEVDTEVRKVLVNCLKNNQQTQNQERRYQSRNNSIFEENNNGQSQRQQEKNSKKHKCSPFKLLTHKGLLRFKSGTKLTSYQYLNFYTFHRALLKDCLIQSDSHKEPSKIDFQKFKKGISVLLKVSIKTVERAIAELVHSSKFEGDIVDFTEFKTFFNVISGIRKSTDIISD